MATTIQSPPLLAQLSANILNNIPGSTRWQSLASSSVRSFAEHFRLATFPTHAGQTLGAFLAYTSLMHIVAPGLSKVLVPKQYNSLNAKTKVNWNVRVVSFVQATFVSYCALRVILGDRENRSAMHRDDRLWGYDPASGQVQAFAAGYFLWDLVVSLRYVDILGVSGLVHAVCALMITMLGFRPFANYYGVSFVLYELSTPFLNIHWALDKLNMTGTSLQLYNGLALISSFFACRLVWGTYQTFLLSRDILSSWRGHFYSGEQFLPHVALSQGVLTNILPGSRGADIDVKALNLEFPSKLLLTYLVANTMLSTLNFYWFGLMVKALLKRFDGTTNADDDKKDGSAKRAKKRD